jgi:hypothetical protein
MSQRQTRSSSRKKSGAADKADKKGDMSMADQTIRFNSGKLSLAEKRVLREHYSVGANCNPDAYPTWTIPVASAGVAYCAWDVYTSLQAGHVTGMELALISIITYFLIDVFSGLVHIVFDNPWFADPTNFFGFIEPFAKGFQEHHLDTSLIVDMSVVEHIQPMCVPMICNFVTSLGFGLYKGATISAYFSMYHICVVLGLIVMQMAHRWSHAAPRDRPWGVSALQSVGVLLSPAEHLKHHHEPYASYFCIMTGWMNPLVNAATSAYPSSKPMWLAIFCGAFFVPHGVMAAML